MGKHARDNRPYIKPVTKIELSEGNVELRWILIVILLSIAVVSFAVALFSGLNTQPGWNAVEVATNEPNCSMDFTLMYDFSDMGGRATAVNKNLTALYTQAAEDAYRIFSPDVSEEGLHNLHYVNAHINEVITVEAGLYRAFETVKAYENRSLYLAPVYMEYDRIFHSESDAEAARFDPKKNPEVMDEISGMVAYLSDDAMIDLELLGENRICLQVSDAYLAYAEENGITEFVDFGWMKNAFIADYLADCLTQQGFVHGYLASYDGFTRNLDSRAGSFSFNVFHRNGSDVYMPARVDYSGPMSIVFLRDFPMDELDRWHYRAYETGEIVTAMIDPADGRSKAAASTMISCSPERSCAEVLMEMLPLYLGESLTEETVKNRMAENIDTIWCEDTEIFMTSGELQLQLLPDADGNCYSAVNVE